MSIRKELKFDMLSIMLKKKKNKTKNTINLTIKIIFFAALCFLPPTTIHRQSMQFYCYFHSTNNKIAKEIIRMSDVCCLQKLNYTSIKDNYLLKHHPQYLIERTGKHIKND
jgi:hypothetical protein